MHLHLDFETRSILDLKEVGLYNYARHPSTDVWCMAWALGDAEPFLWTPGSGLPSAGWDNPHSFKDIVFVAHNAGFEWEIWNEIMVKRYGWPPLRIEQMQCTMEMAYAMALPGKLEGASAAVGIEDRKDLQGGRLMLQMASPRRIEPDGTIVWWDTPDRVARLHEYCKQDVRVERMLHARLMPLGPHEREVSLMSHRINQRGIYVDHDSVKAAVEIAEGEQRRLASELFSITDGVVGYPSEVARLTQWVQSKNVDVAGIAKQDIVDLLADDKLPDDVRVALRIRQEFAKTSVAKLSPMLDAASSDGRLRGMFQYHGASTGRWAGRKVQLHNLPRPQLTPAQVEQALGLLRIPDAARALELVYGPPMTTISHCLRGMLTAAPGHDLIAGDFANIEGRVLAWLAGEQWKLDAFRAYDSGTGPDLYIVAAERFGSVLRQEGKVAELALGFEGGVGAFQRMAHTHGVKVSDAEADRIKVEWRAAHPKIKAYWNDLKQASINAVLHPGLTYRAGHPDRQVAFKTNGSFLWCLLPSDRALCYPYPQIEPTETPWGDVQDALTYMAEDSMTHQWIRVNTYGGKLSENVTQAVARDCLVEAMLRFDAKGANIVMHVHDEIVIEVPEHNKVPAETMARIMAKSPEWAAGLPISVEAWRGKRYRK